jgi:GcrA cell cycle regulator
MLWSVREENHDMEWSDETIAKLRVLWTEGLSTAEIGRRMGISKNAVVGKAHRLLLTSRPSPIRREADGSRAQRPPAPRRVTGPTLPSMAEAVVMATKADPAPEVQLVAATAVAVLRPIATSRPLGAERRRTVACCWPIGEPGTRNFRFCDDESTPGKPYCATHAALAYVKVRDRREDAA